LIDFGYKMAGEAAQALKWASFISSFRACFQKIRPFFGDFAGVVFDRKRSTLAVSFVSLWNVAVGPCFGVLPWKRG